MAENDDFDFFAPEVTDESSPDHTRTKIANYVSQVRNLDQEISDHENKIKLLKAAKDELELKKIPDALLEAGLSELTTLEGLKVTTKLVVGAIPKEAKQRAFSWMDAHGFGSLIKRQVAVSFDKGSTEAAKQAEEAIKALGLTPVSTLDVHHQTWSAFAKEQTGKGVAIPFEDFGVFVGNRAVIK